MPIRTGFHQSGVFGGPVGPEHSGEFLHPFAFSFVLTFEQVVENGAAVDLSLTIALRIMRSEKSMGDLVLGTEVGYLLAKFIPLSEMMIWGSLKRHSIFCQRNLTICCTVSSES